MPSLLRLKVDEECGRAYVYSGDQLCVMSQCSEAGHTPRVRLRVECCLGCVVFHGVDHSVLDECCRHVVLCAVRTGDAVQI